MSLDSKPILQRRLDAAEQILGDNPDDLAFLHSVLAQTSLPYRNPGDDVREYIKSNGRASVVLTAGHMIDPKTKKPKQIGLPYASRPRLLLLHACTYAVRQKNPEIPVGRSMTGFMRDDLQVPTTGPAIKRFKDQLNRLAGSRIQMLWADEDQGHILNPAPVFSRMDVWFSDHPDQQTLWPSTIKLSEEFYQSLRDHALPLHPAAIRALQNNPRALDCYTWLSLRLPRIRSRKGDFISWDALHGQFGGDIRTQRDFKREMLKTLTLVKSVYQSAKIEQAQGGIRLAKSPAPIGAAYVVVD